MWQADVEAFRDHWGGFDDSEGSFERLLARPSTDLSLWLVAFDGDEVAGGVLNAIDVAENAMLGQPIGWLASVFTRRQWRRRGLASALIARSLQLLADRRMDGGHARRGRGQSQRRRRDLRAARLPTGVPVHGVAEAAVTGELAAPQREAAAGDSMAALGWDDRLATLLASEARRARAGPDPERGARVVPRRHRRRRGSGIAVGTAAA